MASRSIDKRYILGLAILVISITGFALKDVAYDQLVKWSVIQKSSPITELYFTEPSKVPKTYSPMTPFTIAFTISNQGDTQKTYTYTVSEYDAAGGTYTELQTGTVTLSPRSEKVTSLQVTPVDLGSTAKFDIQLAEGQQQINFWTTKT